MKKVFCVISHTHWDREWYKPFDRFKLSLVDLIDRLLVIIGQYPDYVFHLDAQTVVLEDYLDIRPDKRDILKTLITNGNIIVGPWYLQNDFYLTSGEATIRNLLEGKRLANEFGRCGNVGYAPDQFGNISQLPQILNGFGINSFVFSRGFNQFEKNKAGEYARVKTPSEFIWEGADGTRALAVYLKYWYNNAQRFFADIEKARELVKRVENSFDGIAATPYLLMMNGVDHLEAQSDLLPILQRLDDEMKDDCRILQYRFDDYIKDVSLFIDNNNVELTHWKGELREGTDFEMLKGTLSSRHYLKVANVRMQNMLENRLEPLYAMLEQGGCKGIYSNDHFRHMWKTLMKNHPHDSICGCSRDEVHQHMEDNYKRLGEFTDEMLGRGLQELAYHSSSADIDGADYILTAVNTIGCRQSGVVEARLMFPQSEKVEGFSIFDNDQNEVEYKVIEKSSFIYDVFSPLNLPGCIPVDCYRIYMYVPSVSAFSARSYIVKKCNKQPIVLDRISDKRNELENECVRITIHNDGKVDFVDKTNSRFIKDLLYIEETADRGDSYIYFDSGEVAILSREFTPAITVTEKNEYRQSCRVTWQMELPIEYEFDNTCRSSQTKITVVSLDLTIEKNDPIVKIGYTIDNQCKDHRIRLAVKAGVVGDSECFADIPFDIVKRTEDQHYPLTQSRFFPNTSFAVLEDEELGTAVFTEGAHEFEQLDENHLAFTLLRSTGEISRKRDLSPIGGDVWSVPQNQCLRTIKGRIGLLSYRGNHADNDILLKSVMHRNPLMTVFAPQDRRKFTGGRPAVQDSCLDELFYLPEQYPGALLEDDKSPFSIEGRHVMVSAYKKAENGHGLILRLFYYGRETHSVRLSTTGKLFKTDMAEENDEFLGTDQSLLSMRPNEIATIRIV